MYNNHTKFDIVLQSGLSDEQKKLAYKLMGYIMIDYKREHCVDGSVVQHLNKCNLLESYKRVAVMY